MACFISYHFSTKENIFSMKILEQISNFPFLKTTFKKWNDLGLNSKSKFYSYSFNSFTFRTAPGARICSGDFCLPAGRVTLRETTWAVFHHSAQCSDFIPRIQARNQLCKTLDSIAEHLPSLLPS